MLRIDEELGTLTDDELVERYGKTWFEKAVWRCDCGITFNVNDMYNWGGDCPVCETPPTFIYVEVDLPF